MRSIDPVCMPRIMGRLSPVKIVRLTRRPPPPPPCHWRAPMRGGIKRIALHGCNDTGLAPCVAGASGCGRCMDMGVTCVCRVWLGNKLYSWPNILWVDQIQSAEPLDQKFNVGMSHSRVPPELSNRVFSILNPRHDNSLIGRQFHAIFIMDVINHVICVVWRRLSFFTNFPITAK